MIIFAFTGQKQSGKSSFADAFCANPRVVNNVIRGSNASALRQMLLTVFQGEEFQGLMPLATDAEKNKEITSLPISAAARNMFNIPDSIKYWTCRLLLMKMGTEVMRSIDEDIWVKILLKDVEKIEGYKHKILVIDDLRFKSELAYLSNYCANSRDYLIPIRITRSQMMPVTNHQSESEIASLQVSTEIFNSDLESLRFNANLLASMFNFGVI